MFWEPTARATDPETSHQAARQIRHRASNDRLLALRVLSDYVYGLTDFELAERTGRSQTSIGVRRGELVKAGFVQDSTFRRPSPSGRAAIVWRVTAAGVKEVQRHAALERAEDQAERERVKKEET